VSWGWFSGCEVYIGIAGMESSWRGTVVGVPMSAGEGAWTLVAKIGIRMTMKRTRQTLNLNEPLLNRPLKPRCLRLLGRSGLGPWFTSVSLFMQPYSGSL
jgi:hypothetical protein